MPAPTLDNVNGGTSTSGSPVSVSLGTSTTNVIICAAIFSENGTNPAPTVTGISGGSLSFVQRSTNHGNTGGRLDIWWALAPTALGSTSFTATLSGSTDATVMAMWGVKGCNTGAPWDTNVGLPALMSQSGGTWTPTFTGINTSEANDFLIFAVGADQNWLSGTVLPSGFTEVQRVAGGFFDFCDLLVAYKAVTSQQSSATFTWGSSVNYLDAGEATFDALTAPGSASPNGFFHNGFSALPSPGLAAAMLGANALRQNKIITRRALLGKR